MCHFNMKIKQLGLNIILSSFNYNFLTTNSVQKCGLLLLEEHLVFIVFALKINIFRSIFFIYPHLLLHSRLQQNIYFQSILISLFIFVIINVH